MTTHLLVTQLRFTRSELLRCIEGVTEEEALKRFKPMNAIGWIIGHLANQENRYWVVVAQGNETFAGLNERVGYGKPASTPPLSEMRSTWEKITQLADSYLDTLTPEILRSRLERKGKPVQESVGTMLMRNIYHYWYHMGEIAAIRQQLGHTDLPEFVGDMTVASYYPEK